jgi:hypothetical protein
VRRCPKCEQTKPAEEFYGGRSRVTECRPCFRQRVREREARMRLVVIDYLLEHPCVDCGETDPVVLEFDHVRGEKVAELARIIKSCVMARFLAELEKCDVRCANCHRRRTAGTQGWYPGVPPERLVRRP